MARTILDEVLGFRPDFIEHQLSHAVRNPNRRAYNRTAFLPERRVMMQAWADYLDWLRAGKIETEQAASGLASSAAGVLRYARLRTHPENSELRWGSLS